MTLVQAEARIIELRHHVQAAEACLKELVPEHQEHREIIQQHTATLKRVGEAWDEYVGLVDALHRQGDGLVAALDEVVERLEALEDVASDPDPMATL